MSEVVSVAPAEDHTVALRADGTLWVWGRNYFGQFGNGTTTSSYTPLQVPGITDVVAVGNGSGHSHAVRADGTLWSWGDNASEQLGIGTITGSMRPSEVLGLSGSPVSVAAGEAHSLLVTATARSIAAGGRHSLIILEDQSTWTFGDNSSGQLGNSHTESSPDPVGVSE